MRGTLIRLFKIANCLAPAAISLLLLCSVARAAESHLAYLESKGALPHALANWNGQRDARKEYQSTLLSNEACSLIDRHDYQSALAKLETAYALAPYMANVNANIGLALNRMGHGGEAIAYLETAVNIAPSEPAPLLTLGSAYERTGNLKGALAVYRRFNEKFPQDRDATMVRGLISGLERELSGTSANSGETCQKDYFEAATEKTKVRWAAPKRNLNVYIAPQAAELRMAAEESLRDWEKLGLFKFTSVSDEAGADVVLKWTSDPAQLTNAAEGGETRLSFRSQTITRATIILLTQRANTAVSLNEIHDVALHEVGHALGIVGHSPSPQDIMYCLIKRSDKRAHISQRDAETLHRIYPELATTCSAH